MALKLHIKRIQKIKKKKLLNQIPLWKLNVCRLLLATLLLAFEMSYKWNSIYFIISIYFLFLLIVIVTIVENECNQYVISKALKIIQNVQTKKIKVKNNINVFIKSCILKKKTEKKKVKENMKWVIGK